MRRGPRRAPTSPPGGRRAAARPLGGRDGEGQPAAAAVAPRKLPLPPSSTSTSAPGRRRRGPARPRRSAAAARARRGPARHRRRADRLSRPRAGARRRRVEPGRGLVQHQQPAGQREDRLQQQPALPAAAELVGPGARRQVEAPDRHRRPARPAGGASTPAGHRSAGAGGRPGRRGARSPAGARPCRPAAASSVDFPAPLPPRTRSSSPGRTVSDRSSNSHGPRP